MKTFLIATVFASLIVALFIAMAWAFSQPKQQIVERSEQRIRDLRHRPERLAGLEIAVEACALQLIVWRGAILAISIFTFTVATVALIA